MRTERAEQAGMTLDRLLESQGFDEVRFRADAREHAIRAIKADLVLEAVARREDIEVTPEEIGARDRDARRRARARAEGDREEPRSERSGRRTGR